MFFLLKLSLLTNASSLENNILEQMPFAKVKLLHVYKRHIPQLDADPMTMPMPLVENHTVSSSIFLLMIFIIILINLLSLEKANGVVLHILYIILSFYVLCSSFITFLVSSLDSCLFASPC